MIEYKLIQNGAFSEDDWDDVGYDVLGEVGLDYYVHGSAYSGREEYCYVPDGRTLDEVIANVPSFIEKLAAYGVEISLADLRYVGGVHVW